MDIQNIALFRGVSDYDCGRMMACFHADERRFTKEELVCDYETTGGRIGIVTEGRVHLVRTDEQGNRTILEQVEEGGIFGECLAFASLPDAVSVIADTACTVVFITYDEISKRCSNACACHTQVTENMFRLISDKALGLSERIEVLSQRSIRDRLLSYFQLSSRRNGTASFSMPFTGAELADYLCVDRSAMLRELKKMREDGLVRVDKRHVDALFLQQ